MRLSAKAQYACVAMVDLGCAQADKKTVQLKNVAEAHGISQRFLVQIMLQLKGAGLVESTRGAMGGYLLARPAERISLADILNAVEQPPALPSALTGLHRTLAVEAVGKTLQELQNQEQKRLEETTIADLVRHAQPAGQLSYQI